MNCSVCYIKLKVENSTKTPCDHFFCSDCIFRWLLRHNSCPICRRKLINREVKNEDLIEYSQKIMNILIKGEEITQKNLILTQNLKDLKETEYNLKTNIKDLSKKEKAQLITIKKTLDKIEYIECINKKIKKENSLLKIKEMNLKIKKLKLSCKLWI